MLFWQLSHVKTQVKHFKTMFAITLEQSPWWSMEVAILMTENLNKKIWFFHRSDTSGGMLYLPVLWSISHSPNIPFTRFGLTILKSTYCFTTYDYHVFQRFFNLYVPYWLALQMPCDSRGEVELYCMF
jgi:hypothetical protein